MRRLIPLLAVSAVALGLGLQLVAGTAGEARGANPGWQELHLPGEVHWQPGPEELEPGAEIAVLHGDPAAEGPFTMRLRMPDGYEIPPHTHPLDEHVTVIAGTLLLGEGSTFDRDALERLPVGSYVVIAEGHEHFAAAEGETVIQIHGEGPFGLDLLDPAEAPVR